MTSRSTTRYRRSTALTDVSDLCVEYGDGTQPTYIGGLAELFGGGIELVDDTTNPTPPPSQLGALGPGQTPEGATIEDGSNLVIITYDVILPQGVEPADQLVNTGSIVQYAGAEGGEDHIAAGPGFSGQVEETASVTIDDPEIQKTITGTDQDYTTGNQVAIGEIITYTVVVDVPEGTSSTVTLKDTLDQGLAFVDCISVLPSSASVTTSLSGGFAAACNDPTNPTLATSDRVITYNLGTVSNSNVENGTAEKITFVYQAVVLNSTGNNRGTQRNNQAVWAWSNGTVQASALNVTVVEPTLTVAKSATPTLADAGDVITFTLTVQHPTASNADALDVVLSDTIPAGLSYVGGSLSYVSGVVPTTLDESVGIITVVWDSFPDNLSSTVRFRTTVNGAAVPGEVIINNVGIVWSSLPGDVTTPQASNSLSTERTGDITDPGAAANDYRAAASAEVDIETPEPVKSIASTSEPHSGLGGDSVERVVIGEIVRFRMTVRMPETTSSSFLIQLDDAVPDGLSYLNDGTATVAFVSNDPSGGFTSSTISDPAPGSAPFLDITGNEANVASITPTFPVPLSAISGGGGSGSDVNFDFGNLQNADQDSDSEFVVLAFNLLVDNVPGNQALDNATGAASPTTLTNTFDVIINGTASGTSTPASVRVAEPRLSMSKTVLTAPSDAGDTIVYRITYANASGADVASAFDIVLVDTLDSNLIIDSHSVIAGGGTCGATPQTTGSIDSGQTVTATVSCLNPGASVTVDITATVAAGTAIGQVIPNGADLSYSSLPGTNGTPKEDTANNPTGSTTPGGPGSPTGERTGEDGAGNLNDYVASADAADVTLNGPAVSKALFSTSAVHTTDPAVTIGEVITYELTINLPEGVATPLVVTDTLPAGLIYLDGAVVVDAAGFGGSGTGSFGVSPSGTINPGDDVVITFPSVTVNADNSPGNNSFKIRLQVRVVNTETNVGLAPTPTVLANTAVVQAGTASSAPSNGVDVTVVEPDMDISKTVDPTLAAANDVVTFTIAIANSGLSNAFNVVVSDTVPVGMTYEAASLDCALGSQTPDSCLEAGGVVTAQWTATPFTTVGGNAVIRFRAKLNSNVVKDQILTNVDASSRPLRCPAPTSMSVWSRRSAVTPTSPSAHRTLS